jgi:hypothetical protein
MDTVSAVVRVVGTGLKAPTVQNGRESPRARRLDGWRDSTYNRAMSTRSIGDVGVAQAVLYFISNDYIVSLPLTEESPYDLIAQDRQSGKMSRVQCKRSESKSRSGKPQIRLATAGGNQSWNKVVKTISSKDVDFVWCSFGNEGWLIPSSEIEGMKVLVLNKDREKFKVI